MPKPQLVLTYVAKACPHSVGADSSCARGAPRLCMHTSARVTHIVGHMDGGALEGSESIEGYTSPPAGL